MRTDGLEEAQCYECVHHHRIPNPKVSIECGHHNVGHSVCACRSKLRYPLNCLACGHDIVDHQQPRGERYYKCEHRTEHRRTVRGLIRLSYTGCECNLSQKEVKINALEVPA